MQFTFSPRTRVCRVLDQSRCINYPRDLHHTPHLQPPALEQGDLLCTNQNLLGTLITFPEARWRKTKDFSNFSSKLCVIFKTKSPKTKHNSILMDEIHLLPFLLSFTGSPCRPWLDPLLLPAPANLSPRCASLLTTTRSSRPAPPGRH